jgi:hypothetical protein
MKTRKPFLSHFAICVENAEYPASLEVHKMYRVVPDAEAAEDGDVRIIDESGEDYLYPAEYFIVIEVSRQTGQALTKSFTRSDRHAA